MMSSRFSFPTDRGHQGADYPDGYYQASAEHLPEQARLEESAEADIAIIGAGFMGCSAALELARGGKKVIVLEANRIGYGASGRNGGQVHIGLSCGPEKLEKLMGRDKAQAVWQWGHDARHHLDHLMQNEGINCDFRPGYVYANHRARGGDELKRHVEHLQAHFGHDQARWMAREEVRHALGTDQLFEGYSDDQCGHLHPLKLVFGLAERAMQAGTKFYEGSRVQSVQAAGPRHLLTTSHGAVKADQVILAVNGLNEHLDPEVERKVMALSNFVAATEPLSDKLCDGLMPKRPSATDSRHVIDYWRITSDNRMLFGGGERYGRAFPEDIAAFVQKHMVRLYPSLAKTRIDYAWGGTLGITPNRVPFIREIKPNCYVAAGFSGQGVVNAPFAGKTLADHILGRPSAFDSLAELPCPSTPSHPWIRIPMISAGLGYHAMLDRW